MRFLGNCFVSGHRFRRAKNPESCAGFSRCFSSVQGLKPTLFHAVYGTTKQAAEKLRKAGPAATKVASADINNRLIGTAEAVP